MAGPADLPQQIMITERDFELKGHLKGAHMFVFIELILRQAGISY